MAPTLAEDASLILIGMRCAGKSTLASIAAKSLKWRVVDENLYFRRISGLSVAEYIDEHGMEQYYRQEVEVLQAMLSKNQTRCIIICSSSCVRTRNGVEVLRCYRSTLPIVHIARDPLVLQRLLQGRWDGNVAELQRSQEPVFRWCANLMFFNTDDTESDPDTLHDRSFLDPVTPSSSDNPTPQSLSLKQVETDFLRFLGGVYGREDHDQQVADDPGLLTYALKLPRGNLKQQQGLDFRSLESCADILLFSVESVLEAYKAEHSGQLWWEYVGDQFAFLRRRTTRDVIYHVGSDLDHHSYLYDIDGVTYTELVLLGLRLAAEYITIDLATDNDQIRKVLSSHHFSKIIGWHHDHDPLATGGWDGNDRQTWLHKAMELGCYAVQLTQPAIAASDNAAVQSFIHRNSNDSLLLSAYNTGRVGRPSQCFNQTLTLVHDPDDIPSDLDTISIAQAQSALFTSFTYEALQYYTMGANVHYSIAPIIQNTSYSLYGMPHSYHITQAQSIDEIESLLQDHKLGGLGLSAPFKTTMMPVLHSMSYDSQAIGAINTIIPIRHWGSLKKETFRVANQRNQGGPILALYGENTDWRAIKLCMLRHLSPANAITPLTAALIVGAGGMARAATYAVIRSGIQNIYIYNRTRVNAYELKKHFKNIVEEEARIVGGDKEIGKCSFHVLDSLDQSWPEGHRLPTVVINCTPIIHEGVQSTTSPYHLHTPKLNAVVSIPEAWLESQTGGVFLELAYNRLLPSPDLLHIASQEGREWIGVNGLEIAVEVFSEQFEFWTGRRAPRYRTRRALNTFLRER